MSEEGVERRLTTILASDVVGYSRLMAADEAGTLTSLKALRRELIEPKTAEYHGRVVKLMGDGTLMEFTSVVDAVRFAVDVQRAMVLHKTLGHAFRTDSHECDGRHFRPGRQGLHVNQQRHKNDSRRGLRKCQFEISGTA